MNFLMIWLLLALFNEILDNEILDNEILNNFIIMINKNTYKIYNNKIIFLLYFIII